MKYKNVIEAEFMSRPNRFIARVKINGVEETVHVKNTGRCKELLVPGAKVYLEPETNPARKTKYDLIAVEKRLDNGEAKLINMDSQIPNAVAGEWLPESGLFSKSAKYKREVGFGNSRFDFYVEDGERKAFLEVKGVTLENDGAVLFPDAPTERGVKHLNELAYCIECGYEAYLLFVVQMKNVKYFTPNTKTHPEFAEALWAAYQKGVKIFAFDCVVEPDSITAADMVEIFFSRKQK